MPVAQEVIARDVHNLRSTLSGGLLSAITGLTERQINAFSRGAELIAPDKVEILSQLKDRCDQLMFTEELSVMTIREQLAGEYDLDLQKALRTSLRRTRHALHRLVSLP